MQSTVIGQRASTSGDETHYACLNRLRREVAKLVKSNGQAIEALTHELASGLGPSLQGASYIGPLRQV